MTCCYYIITTHSLSLVAINLGDQVKWIRWRTCGTQHTIGWRDKAEIQLTIELELYGPGSVVSIATGYELDCPGIEYRWVRDFHYLSRTALGPTQPPTQRVPGLSWGKERQGRDADPSPHSNAVIK